MSEDRKWAAIGATVMAVLVIMCLFFLTRGPGGNVELTVTPSPVEAQAVRARGGMTGSYDEVIVVDTPCNPDAWRASVDFELRQGQEVALTQTVPNDGCHVVCGGGQGQCGATVSPTWDLSGLKPGTYQMWARARWNNLVDGREVVAHPADLAPLEDWRHFLYVEDVCVGECYLPVILNNY